MLAVYRLVFAAAAVSLLASNSMAKTTCQGASITPLIWGLHIDSSRVWHSIGKRVWVSHFRRSQRVFHVCAVDNDRRFLIAQNSTDNYDAPSKFSRFEWFSKRGRFYICHQVRDAATVEEAADFEKNPPAATSSPSQNGCNPRGVVPWRALIRITR